MMPLRSRPNRFVGTAIANLCLLVAVLKSHSVSAQDWLGCVNPPGGTGTDLVRVGEPTTICLNLGPNTHWSQGVDYIRYTFQPEADEYSKFHIPNSFMELTNEQGNANRPLMDQNVTVHVSSQTGISVLRMFLERNTMTNPPRMFVYPFLTAIIDVDKGVVKGIAWDDACVFCSSNECSEISYNFNGDMLTDIGEPTGGCGIRYETCLEALKDDPDHCDLTLYVVWTGTDADGKALESSLKRFSAFSTRSLQNRLGDLVPSISNPFA